MLSATTARNMQSSSATPARLGSKSDIMRPESPRGRTGATGAMGRNCDTPTRSCPSSPTGDAIAWPWCLVMYSLGANKSPCDGPPAKNRKITRFARGRTCAWRAAKGPLAACERRCIIPPNATLPKPQAVSRSSSRRLNNGGNVMLQSHSHQEFVAGQKCTAQFNPPSITLCCQKTLLFLFVPAA